MQTQMQMFSYKMFYLPLVGRGTDVDAYAYYVPWFAYMPRRCIHFLSRLLRYRQIRNCFISFQIQLLHFWVAMILFSSYVIKYSLLQYSPVMVMKRHLLTILFAHNTPEACKQFFRPSSHRASKKKMKCDAGYQTVA